MSADTLSALAQTRPEWASWLALVGISLSAAHSPEWDAMVPAASSQPPLLPHAGLGRNGCVDRLFRNLMECAAGSGEPTLAALSGAPRTGPLAHAAFEAAIIADDTQLDRLASEAGVDAGAFRAVAGLLPVPFLRACGRAWSVPRGWREGYCPLCVAWPAFAEVCGVERQRYLRCGRCGSAWEAHGLVCVYCGTNDHEQLGSLVPEGGGMAPAPSIEVCGRCRGYLKSFTSLSAGPPDSVMIRDLESVELDLAAAERGYRRPGGLARDVLIGYAPADREAV